MLLLILIQQFVAAFKQVLRWLVQLYEKCVYVKQFGKNCVLHICLNSLAKYGKKELEDSTKNGISRVALILLMVNVTFKCPSKSGAPRFSYLQKFSVVLDGPDYNVIFVDIIGYGKNREYFGAVDDGKEIWSRNTTVPDDKPAKPHMY